MEGHEEQTEYDRLRSETIARNRRVLESLGLTNNPLRESQRRRGPSSSKRAAQPPAQPTRKSARLQGGPQASSALPGATGAPHRRCVANRHGGDKAKRSRATLPLTNAPPVALALPAAPTGYRPRLPTPARIQT